MRVKIYSGLSESGKAGQYQCSCEYELFSNLRKKVSGGREGFPEEAKDISSFELYGRELPVCS